LPDAPEPLLLERRVETGEDAFVQRVLADGEVWTWSSVAADFDGGEWSFGAAGDPSWTREETLSPAALDGLREAIAGSDFFATAAEHRPDVPVIHGSREVWSAELDGHRHTTTVHGRGTTQVPALAALGTALDRALAKPG
jgi:hypothetical protein